MALLDPAVSVRPGGTVGRVAGAACKPGLGRPLDAKPKETSTPSSHTTTIVVVGPDPRIERRARQLARAS